MKVYSVGAKAINLECMNIFVCGFFGVTDSRCFDSSLEQLYRSRASLSREMHHDDEYTRALPVPPRVSVTYAWRGHGPGAPAPAPRLP